MARNCSDISYKPGYDFNIRKFTAVLHLGVKIQTCQTVVALDGPNL